MTTGTLAPAPLFQSFTGNGTPNAFGTLATYAAGTSTPQATYTDASLTQPNLNPIQLNPLGQAAVWLNPTLGYKFVWFDQFGNQIGSCDQVYGALTQAALTTILTQSYLGAILYPLTAAEFTASVAPTQYQYPELDIRRYGATTGAADNVAAFNSAILVLAQHIDGELLIPAGFTFNLSQASFNTLTNFNIRCDGVILSSASSLGAVFTNQTASQGVYTPFKFQACSHFKIYGKGYINPNFVDALWMQNCSDFDVALDFRGTGQNSYMHGIFIQYCFQFRVHDSTVSGITGQNMNNATEVYYPFLNNIYVLSCYDFRIDHNISRLSGGNGLQLISVAGSGLFTSCFDFDISNNTFELNSESGCQISYSSGTFPHHFSFSNNLLRYNQADGCDCNNTGPTNNIFASFNGNTHVYNGWINCNPANAGGSDGSGVGTFINVNFFEAIGNTVFEPNNAGIYANACVYFTIADNVIIKTNTGTNQQGCALISVQAGNIVNNVILTSTSVQTMSMNSAPNCQITGNTFQGGAFSVIAAGAACKINGNLISCTAAINVVCDFFDNEVASTVAGLSLGTSSLKVARNLITCAGTAITCASQNYNEIEGNIITTTTSTGIAVTGTTGTIIRNNNVTTAAAGVGISVTTPANNQVEISMNKSAAGSGGLSYSVDNTTTLCNKWGNVSISGTPTFSASTYGINF